MGTIGRNEKRPCGSGKKYKQCHLKSDQLLPWSDVAANVDLIHPDKSLIHKTFFAINDDFKL